MFPEDLTSRLHIAKKDQLFLEVQSLSPILRGLASSGNDEAAINASDAIQVIKRLREEVILRGISDREKEEKIRGDQEIQQKILEPIETSQLDDDLKSTFRTVVLLACLPLLAETIEFLEVIFRP